MGEVINLDSKRAHFSGEAKCLSCSHIWVVVSPITCKGGFECPECGMLKGEFIGNFIPKVSFHCDCGNDLFCLSIDFFQCPACGTETKYLDFIDG